MTLCAITALERCIRVIQESSGGSKDDQINKRVENKHKKSPKSGEHCEKTVLGMRPGRVVGEREGRGRIRVGGFAGAGEEEGHEGGAVAEGMVDAEDDNGGGFGGLEVEDVEIPERAGKVNGGRV